MKKNDYSGKHISSHEIWEKYLQDEKFAKKVGISQKVAKEFVSADKRKKGKK